MKRFFVIIVSVLMLTASAAGPCSADQTGENGKTIPSTTVNIPIKNIVTGDAYEGKHEVRYILACGASGSPMPAGTSGNSTVISGTGDLSTGDIVFTHPEAYHYSLTRADEDTGEWDNDDSAYRITVVKTNTEAVSVTIVNTATSAKTSEIVYRDRYNAPAKHISPKTGDPALICIYAVTLAAAVIALLLLAVSRRSRKERRQ